MNDALIIGAAFVGIWLIMEGLLWAVDYKSGKDEIKEMFDRIEPTDYDEDEPDNLGCETMVVTPDEDGKYN